jgi:glycosyltransferase involved in cell wall biosynthesis
MADKQPLVSIILPVRDGQSSIAATLESAIGQTYGNTEIVVVDDGSRDGTRAIVGEWSARDSRVRLIEQTNRGVAAARNRAIEAARGELIAPLDADDLWDPTKIERQVRRLLEAGDGTGMVYCWWVSIDLDGAVIDWSPRWRIEGRTPERLLQVNYTGNASVPLYRRRCLQEVGGYDERLRERAEGCEDWDLALKVAERWSVAVVPSALVAYRRTPGSMSGRTDRMKRAYTLVLNSARQRRPSLPSAVIRNSQDTFAWYLSGVSFRSGAYRTAIAWGLRALRSSLAIQVLPYAVRLSVDTLLRRSRPNPGIIRPGVAFSQWPIPDPVIPYDRIYERRFKRLHSE